MNILVLLPKLQGGGAEKVGTALAAALARRHPVWLVTLQGESPDREAFSFKNVYPEAKKIHLEAIPQEVLDAPGEEGRRTSVEKRAAYIREFKKSRRIQVSISFLEQANYINVLSKGNEKVIVSVRNNYEEKIKTGSEIFRTWCKDGTTGADQVVAISEGVRQSLIRLYGISPDKICTIYNPCNPKELRRAAEEAVPERIRRFAGGARLLVHAGRLVPQKGQRRLISAFKQVRERIPDAKLVILGDGPLREELEDAVGKADLKDAVLFAGYVQNPYPVIRSAELLLVSSEYEGLGNTILEAMAIGTPVISTDCRYGPRELLIGNADYDASPELGKTGPAGVLTPLLREQTEEIYADAVVLLLRNKKLQAQHAARASEYAERFSEERIWKQWRNLFPGIWWRRR